MLAKILTGATSGLNGALVEVEVDLAQGLPKVTVVGLPDAAVQPYESTHDARTSRLHGPVFGRRKQRHQLMEEMFVLGAYLLETLPEQFPCWISRHKLG